MNIIESNNYIIKSIKDNKSFSIVRLGIGAETYITYEYLINKKINHNHLYALSNNAGIYTNDVKLIIEYCKCYDRSIKHSDALACFRDHAIDEIQKPFIAIYTLDNIHSRSLEPFYAIMEKQIPWTYHLKGKKVLVINPFVESFKKQLKNKFKMFKNADIFSDGQEFIFYKSYNTSAGNHIHKDWYETFEIMRNDIKNIDFDIALLGCGGYGLPLCDFIKSDLNKSAIYIGGGLQLLFGVMGRRWENNDFWKKIIAENGCNFIKPSGDEIISNNQNIEGGCYW